MATVIPDLNVASSSLKGILLGTKIEKDGNTYRWFKTAASPVAAFASGQLLYHRATSGAWAVSNDISDCTNGRNMCACYVPQTITTVPVSGGTADGAIYFWGQTGGVHTYMKKLSGSVMSIGALCTAHATSDGVTIKVATGTWPSYQIVSKAARTTASTGTTRFSGFVLLEGGGAV